MITLQDVKIEVDTYATRGPYSLTLRPGVWLGVVGPSGSGKSLLLKVLAGLVEPTSGHRLVGTVAGDDGELTRAGLDADELRADEKLKLARTIRYLPQEEPFDTDVVAGKLMRMRAALRGYRGKQLKQVMTEMVEQWWLERVLNKPLWRLSRPVRRRLALAEVFMGRPRVVLLDDPFWGSEDNQTRQLRDVLIGMHDRRQLCVVCAARDANELAGVADEVLELGSTGEIRYHGPATAWPGARSGVARFRIVVKGPGGEIRRLIEAVDGVADVLWHEGGVFNAYQVMADQSPRVREHIFRSLARRSYPIIELACEETGLAASFDDAHLRNAAMRRGDSGVEVPSFGNIKRRTAIVNPAHTEATGDETDAEHSDAERSTATARRRAPSLPPSDPETVPTMATPPPVSAPATPVGSDAAPIVAGDAAPALEPAFVVPAPAPAPASSSMPNAAAAAGPQPPAPATTKAGSDNDDLDFTPPGEATRALLARNRKPKPGLPVTKSTHEIEIPPIDLD